MKIFLNYITNTESNTSPCNLSVAKQECGKRVYIVLNYRIMREFPEYLTLAVVRPREPILRNENPV
jgi:hypothetical protein